MSAPMTKEEITFRQRLLASAGFYRGVIDGISGLKTMTAEADWREEYLSIRNSVGASFDLRTEGCIQTLLPKAQRLARAMLRFLMEEYLTKEDLSVSILSGTRTYEEQNTLFKKGRFGNPGPRVTNARGGFSNHNFGLAWDIGLFEGGRYLRGDTVEEVRQYDRAGALASQLPDIEWGGHWRTPDRPHFQVGTSLSLAEVRAAFEAGRLRV